MGGEPRTAKLGPTNHLRLLFILIPIISLLLFILILTGTALRPASQSFASHHTGNRQTGHQNLNLVLLLTVDAVLLWNISDQSDHSIEV